jgi:C-terminal processing protease CtpA/Prc
MQSRKNVTAYVGLPQGKIGITVANEPNSCGVDVLAVTGVTESSPMRGILCTGDIITKLNGKNVPGDEMPFTDDISVEEMQQAVVDEFVNILNTAGDLRYMLITHDQTTDSNPYMATTRMMNAINQYGKSIDVQVPDTTENLGISVALEGYEKPSGLDMTLSRMMSTKERSNIPLRISRISDSSQLNGQVLIGDQITHVNGHLLIGIYPGEFAEIMKDIGRDKENRLILTVLRS